MTSIPPRNPQKKKGTQQQLSKNKTMSSTNNNTPPLAKLKLACVLGGGAYGTALAQVLARGGTKVQMWIREADVVQSINTVHENKAFLKGKL